LQHVRGEAQTNSRGVEVVKKHPLAVNCKCSNKCLEIIDDECRSVICNEYYALSDYNRQKDYNVQNTSVRPVKTRVTNYRTLPDGSRDLTKAKEISVAFYLNVDET